MRGLSLVAASGGHSSSQCAGLSLSRPLVLRSTGSRRAGSVIVAHGPSCSAACGILPDQGSNPCPLHWQADSQPLCHQGSPVLLIFIFCIWHSIFNHIHAKDCYVFFGNQLLWCCVMPLCLKSFLVLKSVPSEINIATPAFFWLQLAWNMFFCPVTFNLSVSVYPNCVSCRQHRVGSCLLIHSDDLCL